MIAPLSSLIIGKLPDYGATPLNVPAVVDAWGGDCVIYQHGGSFRLVRNAKDGFKITISADQAAEIIELLKLTPKTDELFRRAVSWRKSE